MGEDVSTFDFGEGLGWVGESRICGGEAGDD